MEKIRISLALFFLVLILLSGCVSQQTNQEQVPGPISSQYTTSSAQEWVNKGNEFFNQGRTQEAVDAYDKALSFDPNNSLAWNGKGNALFNLGKTQEALDAFNKALSINPNFSSAWHGKGNALFNLGKPQEALYAYNQALSIDTNNQWAWFGKGNVLFSLGKYQEALEAYDRVLSINVNNSPAWASKGNTLLQLGRTQEAIQAFDRALSIDPNNQWAKAGKNSALSGSPIPPLPPQPAPQIPQQPIPPIPPQPAPQIPQQPIPPIPPQLSPSPSQPVQRYPISDGHAHLYNMGDPVQNADNLVKEMDNAGVVSAVLFGGCDQPYPNRDVYVNGIRADADQRVFEAYQKYPTRFYPMLSGFNPQDPNAPLYIEQQLATGIWKGIGEIYMVHESLPTYKTLANHPVMLQIYRVLARYKAPIFFHYERWAQEDIDTLYTVIGQNPDVTFVWVHFAHTNDFKEIDTALGKYPNLYISWEGPVSRDMGSSLESLSLLEKYPGRFIIGSDVGCMENFLTPTLNQPYINVIELHQTMLSRLSPLTAGRIAHGNVEEMMGEPVKVTPTQQEKSGTILRDEVWSGEILITDHVTIPKGVTVTILPGSKVKFQHYRGYQDSSRRLGMSIYGTLISEGSPQSQIWFTSDAPDPTNGDWWMIRFIDAGSQSVLKYTIIEFALHGVNLWSSSPLISHSIIRWNNWEGIYLESYCHPVVEYNMIYENGYNGIAMEQFNDAMVRYNTIMNSGTNGIHVDASTGRIENNIIVGNHASGLSVDDNGVLIATSNTIKDNRAAGIFIADGANRVVAHNNLFVNNGLEISPFRPPAVVENVPGTGAGDIMYDYPDQKPYVLGYIPGDFGKDRYMYIYPDVDETRRIIRKIGQGLGRTGLTWSVTYDGESIWTADLNGDVYQLVPETGEVLTSWIFPGVQAWGMTFDGTNLWINDFAEMRIYQMDTKGNVLSSFPIPDRTGGAKGLTWDGTYLYLLGWTSSTIYQLDKNGIVHGIINIKTPIAGGGLAWDGQYFWAPGCKGICKIAREGTIVGSIYAASEGTWDMEWDGRYLWATQRTNENWRDAKIYQIEVLQTIT